MNNNDLRAQFFQKSERETDKKFHWPNIKEHERESLIAIVGLRMHCVN